MPATLRRRPADTATLLWANPTQPSRSDLEACVARVFRHAHDARISHFHDLLVGARDPQGDLLGVIGASSGMQGRLFLEAYTGQPMERLISRHSGRHVARSQIVEVGNLAVEHPGAACLLVQKLAEHLQDQGVRWVVLTGTTRVRHILRRLGAELVDFGEAPGSAMGESLPSWGSYYENDPRVVAIELAPFCAGFARGKPLVARVLARARRVARRAVRIAFPARPVFSHA